MRPTLFLAALLATVPANAQQVFPAPEAAVDALVDGLSHRDAEKIRVVLGPEYRRLVPLDPVSEEDRAGFLAAWSQGHRVESDGPSARLVLSDGWTLPIPIVRGGAVPRGAPGHGARERAAGLPRTGGRG